MQFVNELAPIFVMEFDSTLVSEMQLKKQFYPIVSMREKSNLFSLKQFLKLPSGIIVALKVHCLKKYRFEL